MSNAYMCGTRAAPLEGCPLEGVRGVVQNPLGQLATVAKTAEEDIGYSEDAQNKKAWWRCWARDSLRLSEGGVAEQHLVAVVAMMMQTTQAKSAKRTIKPKRPKLKPA